MRNVYEKTNIGAVTSGPHRSRAWVPRNPRNHGSYAPDHSCSALSWAWTWLMACGRADLLPKIKNLGSYRLCSLHFENKMFTNIVYKNRLLPTATPTKFPSMESSSSTTSNDHAYCLNPQSPGKLCLCVFYVPRTFKPISKIVSVKSLPVHYVNVINCSPALPISSNFLLLHLSLSPNAPRRLRHKLHILHLSK
ncbi:hypothetical protein RI129_005704 [Pyrocoelia pectoralis]|uniref:THAP-type domain-containing protein n=1 Tax=Pyrocoelia pectoralis TaxID=417401 RepID=A0AAN7VIY3_9COLE